MLEPIALIGIAGLWQILLGLIKSTSLLMTALLTVAAFFGLSQIATIVDYLSGSTISVGINPNIAGYVFLICIMILPNSIELNNSVYNSTKFRILLMALCVSTGSSLAIILLITWQITLIRKKLWMVLLVLTTLLALAPFYIESLLRSIAIRLEIWKIALNISEANSWSGIGVNGFSNSFSKFRTLEFVKLKSEDTLVKDPHNIFINVLVSDGILLALLFALVFSVLYIKFIRHTTISVTRKLGLTFALIFFSTNILSLLVALVSVLALHRDFESNFGGMRAI